LQRIGLGFSVRLVGEKHQCEEKDFFQTKEGMFNEDF